MWLLTTQPSLIRALETKAIPRSVEQMQVNQSYFGYVASIQPFGVFVSFLDTLQALVPLRYLSSRFVKDAKDVVRVGQAVRVTCTDIKEKKVEASLLGANDAETEMLYMLSLEEEQLRLMDLGKTLELNVSDEEEEEEEEEGENEEEDEEENEEEEDEEEANNTSDNEDEEKEDEDEDEEEKDSDAMEEEEEEEEEDKPFDWKACPLGTVCSGHIKTVRDYGVIVEMDNGFIGFAPSPLHTENISLTEGTAVTARILDVNASLQLYDITLSQRFLPDSTSTSSPSLAQGESVQGTIVVQKPDYVVLALNTPAKSLVLGSMTSFNNAKQPFSGLNLGDEVDCTLLCAPGVGGAVCDLRNAFKDTLSAADSEAIRSFFAEVSVGDLSSKTASKDASKGSSKARLLSDKAMELPRELVGKKVTVRVVEITPSVVFVALPKSVAEGNGSVAAIWATDVDGKKEGKWPETIVKDATVEAK